ncbi:MAG: hypothetical protein ACUVXA_04400 [Candidatus Jordarchaeum sp.]|uniref:hypothetical protein n=1 Tax=Candidatus Jordarchaeum sp. TaxID=2823881 RepID=UPI00404AFE80
MTKTVFQNLRELVNSMDEGKTKDIHKCLERCWKEFYIIEKDPDIPSEVFQKTRKLLEEITVAIEAYEVGAITVKEFNRIKVKVFEE